MRSVFWCSLLAILYVLALAFTLRDHSQDALYVAPVKHGTGNGRAEKSAALYTNRKFWAYIKSSLVKRPITVHFLEGEYTNGVLTLAGIGHVKHRLTVQGNPEGKTVFRIDSEDKRDPNTGFFVSRGCQNIAIRNLHFTGRGTVEYISRVTGSTDIVFEHCSWIDLPNIISGATGTMPEMTITPANASYTGTHHITFRNCVFKRVGTTPRAHMIYNAYGPRHISVINCYFEDCSGDYVRFRDLSDYCVVNGCTFRSTGNYPPSNPVHRPFVSIPLFVDVDPGDEWFGTHFFISGNKFIYEEPSAKITIAETIAVKFYHEGYDSPGRSSLLTPGEGAILGNGTAQARKTLLQRNCGIDVDEVYVSANDYEKVANKAVYGWRADHGAKSRGREEMVEIFDLLNHEELSLEDWIARQET
ncbi:hypothetical protein ACFL1X_02880 [Candidatus Hydrogenedentota bacterium]